MHRVLFAIHRKPELSFDEFLTHYREVHIPIARELPKLQEYDLYPVQPGPDGDRDGATPDAFTMMAFDSVEDFQTFLASPQMGAIAEDNDTFIDRFEMYTVDAIPVIGG
jgi:uncharacterized protein (TIGR02118 family)